MSGIITNEISVFKGAPNSMINLVKQQQGNIPLNIELFDKIYHTIRCTFEYRYFICNDSAHSSFSCKRLSVFKGAPNSMINLVKQQQGNIPLNIESICMDVSSKGLNTDISFVMIPLILVSAVKGLYVPSMSLGSSFILV
jgi:high-affinity K+ transport system ATPase subunit B